MRSVLFVCFVSVIGWGLAGCDCCGDKDDGATAAARHEATKTYECTACQDKVTWMYNSKGLRTGFKKVEHSCPSCKRAWGANLSTTNTCAECAKTEKMCPTCLAKGG